MNALTTVNRFEIVDHTSSSKDARPFIKWVKEQFDVDYDIQDNGKTLKIFLKDLPKNEAKL